MPASFTCPECAASLTLPPQAAGKKIRCASCQAVFVLPAGGAVSPEPRGVPRPPSGPRTARRAPGRPDRGREHAEGPDDDFTEPRPLRRGKNGSGLLIGLLVGGAVLLLTCAGGMGALLWYAAGRGQPGTDGGPAAQAPNDPAAGRNVPFVPPDINPLPMDDPPPPQPQPQPQRPGRWTGGMARFRDDQILTVVVTGVRDDKVGKYVLDKLARQLPPSNSSTRSHLSGGVMQVALAPVGDPQAFANKIDFGTVSRVDGRVVYATVKELNLPAPGAFPTPRPARLQHEPPAAGDLPDAVGSWSFDEGKEAQAGNTAGSRQPAVLHNTHWVPGVRGQALSFKDPDSYVDLGSSDDLNFPARTAFAAAAWVQPAKSSGTLLSLRHSDDESALLELALDGGRISVTLRYDGNAFGPLYHVAGRRVDDENWHHVLLQRQADGRLELYVDGALAETTATAGGPLTTNMRSLGRERFWLEKKFNLGDAHYEGCLDEVGVFKRALTAEEIRKLAGQD